MDQDATIAMLERLGDAVHPPSPGPGGLVRLGREARSRRRRTRTYVAAVLVVGVAGGAVMTHEIRDDGPVAAVAPGTRLVTDPDEVVGEWRVVEVDGDPPPEDAARGLRLEPIRARQMSASWFDGANTVGLRMTIGSDGTLVRGGGESTLVACDSCTVPSGFGVRDAAALGLTNDGQLVFLASDGSRIAVYERARCVDVSLRAGC